MQTKYLPENTNPQNNDWLLTENDIAAQKLSIANLLALAGTPTNLDISDIDGLQSALNGKVNLTDIPALIPAVKSPHPGFVSSKYYSSSIISGTVNNAFGNGFVYYTYFYIPTDHQFTRIAFINNTSFGSAEQVRLGIYKVESGLPTTLIVDAGVISFTTTGTKEATISTNLIAGWYAVAMAINPSAMSINTPAMNFSALLGQSIPAITNFSGLRASLTFGSLPNNASLSSLTETNTPIFWLKAA